jgi:hypothetical protein
MVSTLKLTKIQIPNSDSDVLSFNSSTGIMTFHKDIQGEGTATTNLQQGLAKAWLSMNGTGTIAVRDSFNMTGITDQGTGLTTVTIANNMSSAEYSVGGASGTFIANSDNVRFGLSTETEPPTSTLFRTITREANDDTNRDVTYSFTQVFGDLA